MSLKPKTSFTVPRRNEMHKCAPGKYLICKHRMESQSQAQVLPKQLNRIYKEESESETDTELARKHRYTASSEEYLYGAEDEEDEDEEDERTIHAQLYTCFENLNELMPNLEIDEDQVSIIEQRLSTRLCSSVQTTAGFKPLHSNAALSHAEDSVLVPCQQKKIEKLPIVGLIQSVSKRKPQNGLEKLGKSGMTVSVAQQLAEQHNRRLTAPEIIVMSVRNYWFDNMELKIGDSFMHIDRYVFQYFCSTFANHNNFYLELPDQLVPMKLLVMVYQWLISEKNEELELDANYLSVYSLAKFLGIRRLLEQFWYTFSMSAKFGFWEQSAFYAYVGAREKLEEIAMPCADMMAILLSRIRKCFLPLVASVEFLEFNVHEVLFVLKMDTICVNSEDEMFFAAVRWLEHDWLKRRKYIVDIMGTIRIRLLSPWLQRSIIYNPENSLIRSLGSNIYVRSMLWDSCLFGASMFTCNKLPKCELNSVFKEHFKPDVIVQRIWVYCPGVPHHHDIKCSHYRQLTYETFKLFLIALQSRSQFFVDAIKYSTQKHWVSYKCCEDYDSKTSIGSKRVIPAVYSKHI